MAPNRLAGRPAPTRPNEVWVADITYVATAESWLYVAGVLDLCTRKLVGWAASDSLATALVARAFTRAVTRQRPGPGLLHHSDRGSQYASDAYRMLLRQNRVTPSMSRRACCYDNATMESFWATLKTELIDGRVFDSREQARSALFRLRRGLLQPGATPRRARLPDTRGIRAEPKLDHQTPGTPPGPQPRSMSRHPCTRKSRKNDGSKFIP